MSGIFAFGARAQALGERFAQRAHPLVIADSSGAVPALQRAVELRKTGLFDALFVLDDQATAQARRLGKEILRSTHDFDVRRNAFELLARGAVSLGGRGQAEFGVIAAPIAKTLRDISALANRWVVRSWKEYYRNAALLGRKHAHVDRRIAFDDRIPRVDRDTNADAVVVWAPDEIPENIAVILFALEELRRPAYVVCRFGATYGLRTSLVPPSDAASVLRRAALVIDASAHDPSAALTFLSYGIPAIATVASGAVEYAPALRTFQSSVRRSVVAAVLAALGEGAASVTLPASPNTVRTLPATVKEPKDLVSLIVRTADRPRLLRRALESISAQTYGNVETIVVNNGGSNVRSICDAFENVRYLDIEKTGIWSAANAGVKQARGAFAGLLDDDDALFPDHVERLVHALARSKAPAAYANAMNVYLQPAADNFSVAGYAAVLVPAVVPSMMAVQCAVVGSSRVLFARDVLEEIGMFDESFPVAGDFEYWLRILQTGPIVRVDAITSMYSQFTDRSNVSLGRGTLYAEALERIYEKYPVERPALLAQRADLLRQIRQLGGLGMMPRPLTFDPQTLLFAD